jgi:lysozyme
MKVSRKCTMWSGLKYYGEINSKKEPHGYGCCLTADGTYYEGEWLNGKTCGKGGQVDAD